MTRIKFMFTHPPDPRLPWTDDLARSAIGKPLRLLPGGNLLGKIIDARLGAAGHAEFEVELFTGPSAAVNVTKGEVDYIGLVDE